MQSSVCIQIKTATSKESGERRFVVMFPQMGCGNSFSGQYRDPKRGQHEVFGTDPPTRHHRSNKTPNLLRTRIGGGGRVGRGDGNA